MLVVSIIVAVLLSNIDRTWRSGGAWTIRANRPTLLGIIAGATTTAGWSSPCSSSRSAPAGSCRRVLPGSARQDRAGAGRAAAILFAFCVIV
jgi:hypothetical protein